MATGHTDHLNLTKPAYDDAADIEVINDNMDVIDTAIYNLQNKGSANAGKFLVVANDGTVTPTTVPSANGVSF